MKVIEFPPENYTWKSKDKYEGYVLNGERVIGLLELLYAAVHKSPYTPLSESDHKLIKKIKKAIKQITMYKDKDEDSRIASEGPQKLLLEDTQYELMIKLVKANSFLSSISDEYSDLLDILNNPQEFTPKLLE